MPPARACANRKANTHALAARVRLDSASETSHWSSGKVLVSRTARRARGRAGACSWSASRRDARSRRRQRRTGGLPAACRPPAERAGRPVRPIRDEHATGDRADAARTPPGNLCHYVSEGKGRGSEQGRSVMLPTRGYATKGPNSLLEPFNFERRDPGAHDVLIEILYCGICHSDIHQARDEWGGAMFPMAA